VEAECPQSAAAFVQGFGADLAQPIHSYLFTAEDAGMHEEKAPRANSGFAEK